MNERQTLELFKQHKTAGDYDAAAVMLGWARVSGRRHHLWSANMALLLFAHGLGLYDEATTREDWQEIGQEVRERLSRRKQT